MFAQRLGLVILMWGCGRPVTSRPAPTVASRRAPAALPAFPAPPPAPARPVPDPFAGLNLDFEAVNGDQPRGWTPKGDGYEVAAVTDVVHGGTHSLRIRSGLEGGAGVAIAHADAAPFVGKHLRLHAWIQSELADGTPTVFLRIDGGEGGFDRWPKPAVAGRAGWTEAVVELDVGPGATDVVFGPMLAGAGSAWFDDLRFEVTAQVAVPPPAPIVLAGTVVDARGPVAGAEVALVGTEGIAAHARSDVRGRFQFETPAGRWGISAHHAGAVGGFLESQRYDEGVHDLQIGLAAAGGVTVEGRAAGTPAPDTYLGISRVSSHGGDAFAVPVAADGSFAAILPRGDEYHVAQLDLPVVDNGATFRRKADRVEARPRLLELRPAPREVVGYIAAHAIPLASVEPGHGFDDLAPLGTLVGDAHVVALGEATHGAREFFQLKHRLLEYLVARRGFTMFAIEANQPECRAINAYVVDGKGTARDALAGIHVWTWNTEEVLAMIEWMRAWNADPAHGKKLQFAGFDMQAAIVAHANVAAFVQRAAGRDAEARLAPVAVLGREPARELVARASAEERAKLTGGLATLATAFARSRKPWTAATSPTELADALHDLTILGQFTRQASDASPDGPFAIRDQAMADNLGWLRAQHPGERIVVWAHNGHIANELSTYSNMGSHLRARWKADYVNVGLELGEGAFQALDLRRQDHRLAEITLGAAPAYHASAAFTSTGKPVLALDLRALPARGVVHDWFAAPHPVRDTGGAFSSERFMTITQRLPRLYDAVIVVARTTRARPLTRPANPR